MTVRFRVVVCRGPDCGDRRNSAAVFDAAKAAIATLPEPEAAMLDWQSCFGRCSQGPNVLVREMIAAPPASPAGLATMPGPRGRTALYSAMTPEKIERVVTEHVGRGTIVREYIERPATPTEGMIVVGPGTDPGASKP